MPSLTIESEQLVAPPVEVPEGRFRVTIKSRAYHADLLEAARKFGGIRRFANHLGINPSTLNNWILLKYGPSLVRFRADGLGRYRSASEGYMSRWPEIERKLTEATGKNVGELFPDFMRLPAFKLLPKKREETREVSAGLMLGLQAREESLLLSGELDDFRAMAEEAMSKRLTGREAELLKLRLGWDGPAKSRRECCGIFGVSDTRVDQIRDRAVMKLRDWPEFDRKFRQFFEKQAKGGFRFS